MPNHVTNKLEIHGALPMLSTIRQAVSWTDGEDVHAFSFKSIIPMPKCLRYTTSGSWVAEAVWLLDEKLFFKIKEEAKSFRSFMFIDDPDMLKRLSRVLNANEEFVTKDEAVLWLTENRPGILEDGKAAIEAYKETGFVDWYEWSTAHWGTKWDAYSVNVTQDEQDNALIIVFDTAWSTPDPVITNLAATYPTVQIVHSYFGEGHNFWGVDIYENGVRVLCRDSEPQDYARLCLELKGYYPNEDDTEIN